MAVDFNKKFKKSHKRMGWVSMIVMAALALIAVATLVWMIKFMQLISADAPGKPSEETRARIITEELVKEPEPVAKRIAGLRKRKPTAEEREAHEAYLLAREDAADQKEDFEASIAFGKSDPSKAVQISESAVVAAPAITFVTWFTARDCTGESLIVGPTDGTVPDCEGCWSTATGHFPSGKELKPGNMEGGALSIRVTGPMDVDIYEESNAATNEGKYWASIMELDSCVNVFDWPPWGQIRFVPGTLDTPLVPYTDQVEDEKSTKKYVVAYSCESSIYFGYQAYANYYGFRITDNNKNGRHMRLLTNQVADDLASQVPTFTAKRHPYSRRYGPINKADVITKWYASPHAPTEEVVVVIDPDNWLTASLDPWVEKVRKGHGIAQRAFYGGSTRTVTDMYKMFCTDTGDGVGHCDNVPEMSAVPYLLHREDFGVVAPLWKMYSLKIKEGIEADKSIARRFSSVQVEWCAEMFGFNMACAHAGIEVSLENSLQIRDIETRPVAAVPKGMPMIHMGRAWFPKGSEEAKPFLHTEGASFSYFGDQVWCKCNTTGNDVLPWPVPEGLDFVSDITLRYLHDSRALYGKPTASAQRPDDYHNAHA
jgi:hypothetical protein